MNDVPQERQGANGHEQGTHRADLVDQGELGVVFRDPSWHAIEPKPVLWSKAKVEADERECTVEAAQVFIQHASSELWIPVINRGKNNKYRASKNDVMEVSNNEISVVHMNVKGNLR